jgi:hypothetical protein
MVDDTAGAAALSSAAAAEPTASAASPFLPKHLLALLLRPSKFFTAGLDLGRTSHVWVATWVLGMAGVIDRIDQQILRAQFSSDARHLHAIQQLAGTWPRFWGFSLVFGILWGAFAWWVGGWWCKVRLRWSGDPAPDPRLARLLLVYASFVYAAPAVLAAVAQTGLYPSYLVAFESEWVFTAIVIVTTLWSCFTMYKGAVALFHVRRGRAALWFVGLPFVFYFLITAGATVLLTLLSKD